MEMDEYNKIEIEDYVITFLRQLAKDEEPFSQVIALVGEQLCDDHGYCYRIYGALEVGNCSLEEGEVLFNQDGQEKLLEACRSNFPNYRILGWAIIESSFHRVSSEMIGSNMEGALAIEDKIMLHMHKDENWEHIFAYGENHWRMLPEFTVFYDKNIEMQQYLIYWNQQHHMQFTDSDEDVATRRFRKFMQEQKRQSRENKQRNYLAMVCMVLMIVIMATGISMMNNYEKLQGVEQAVNELSAIIESDRLERELQVSNMYELSDEEDMVTHALGDDALQESFADGLEDISGQSVVQDRIHEVQAGDTLHQICRNYYESDEYIEAICELNQITNPDQIQIGQKILLPW